MLSENEYLRILGVNKAASQMDIKRAYRSKAKYFHPDVNKDPGAHEQFVLLTEAYEYFTSPKPSLQYSAYWTESERRRQAREKAAAYARMRYQEFLNSDYYKSTSAIAALLDAVIVIFLFVMLVFVNLVLKVQYGNTGLGGALIFDALIFVLFVAIAKGSDTFRIKKYVDALGYLITWLPFNAVLMSIINIYLFLRIDLQTLIPLNTLILVFMSMSGLAYLGLRFFHIRNDLFSACCLIPLLINSLFWVNYSFTGPLHEETYVFEKSSRSTGSREETTLIRLENDQYDAYPGMRVFADFTQIPFEGTITYTMGTGCFRIEVMKAYRFEE